MSDDKQEQPGPDEAFRGGFKGGPDGAYKPSKDDDTEAHGRSFGKDAGPPDEAVRGKGVKDDEQKPGPDDAYAWHRLQIPEKWRSAEHIFFS